MIRLARRLDPRPRKIAITERHLGRSVDVFKRSSGHFDPKYLEPASDAPSYLICFVQRSGSTMLRSLLTRTGKLGKPEEFLNPRGVMQLHIEHSGARNLTEYFAYLRAERATKNGVFGMKATYPDLLPLIETGALRTLLGPIRFVYLVRRDLLRQSVSAALAERRNVWHVYSRAPSSEIPRAGEPRPELVIKQLDRIIEQQGEWERFFAIHRIEPLRISYEEMVAEPGRVVHDIAALVGLDIPAERIRYASETEQLPGEENERWLEAVAQKYALS